MVEPSTVNRDVYWFESSLGSLYRKVIMNIYFTSDLHLGHRNILKLSNRPFGEIEHHDDVIIDNYNKIVGKDDVCYILGDIAWNQSYENYKKIFSRLNGRKYIIIGNHDNKQHLIRCQKDGLIISVESAKNLQIGKDNIYLSHYPMREWSGFYRGAYHLYGHCHGNLDDYKQSTDIGVDCWEYEPVSYEEVKEYIDNNCEPNII